jgi:hypothetical protein
MLSSTQLRLVQYSGSRTSPDGAVASDWIEERNESCAFHALGLASYKQ